VGRGREGVGEGSTKGEMKKGEMKEGRGMEGSGIRGRGRTEEETGGEK